MKVLKRGKTLFQTLVPRGLNVGKEQGSGESAHVGVGVIKDF